MLMKRRKILPFTKIIKASFTVLQDASVEYVMQGNNVAATEILHNYLKKQACFRH
jgi:hypothetical protein